MIDSMKIYVCVKHVPDTAATITIKDKNRFDESIIFMMNPYDEHAVEEALKVREQFDDAEVIAVTLGKSSAIHTLRHALAMGADRGIFIETGGTSDSILTAKALEKAIEQDGEPDIIFTGKEAIDTGGMQTMYRLAAGMDLPVSTNVAALSVGNGRVTLERETQAGDREIIEMPLPCVIGAGKELNEPRYTTFKDIMKANKKSVKTLNLENLALKAPEGGMEIVAYEPIQEDRRCNILEGPPEAAVEQLVGILRDEENVF
jgi:electron transfer flavoprotein beta subunit